MDTASREAVGPLGASCRQWPSPCQETQQRGRPLPDSPAGSDPDDPIRLQIYDMGRRVVPLPCHDFRDFETNKRPYPLPLRRQAWFGLLFHHRDESEVAATIWFLHFPLDEQAKLVLAARDDFMRRLLENLGETTGNTARMAETEVALQDNPYAFRPKPERMAVFHAQVTAALQQPASPYYAHACDYFSGRLGWEQWSFLGYQGIADLAARLAQDDNRQRLKTAIPELPPAPLEALCHNNILNDLLYLPGIRRELLTALKTEGRSERLSEAIERFFATVKSA